MTSNAHKRARDRFVAAKDKFNQLKLRQDEAKRRHAAAASRFKDAKNSFLQAKDDLNAFKARQHEDKKVRQEQKGALTQKAGIPRQYWNDLVVKTDRNGNVNIYFGGAGCADGSGHGHASMDSSGHVTYMRNPYEPHGAQNYTDYVDPDDSPQPDMHNGRPTQWESPRVGTIDGHEVTVRFGRNGKEGQTLISDGFHINSQEEIDNWTRNHDRHEHYGSGDGINSNGTNRGAYTGPGSSYAEQVVAQIFEEEKRKMGLS